MDNLPALLQLDAEVKQTGANGLHFTFHNGITVSVQWGPGTYSDNHDLMFHPNIHGTIDIYSKTWPSQTAEVYAWLVDTHPKWCTPKDHPNGTAAHVHVTWLFTDTSIEEPAGWRTVEQVKEILRKAAAWQDTPENRQQIYDAYRRDKERWDRLINGDNTQVEGEQDAS